MCAASKWSHINENGIKLMFVTFLYSFDQNTYLGLKKKESLYVLKLIFWNFHRYLVLLWSLFCFWEVLKQSKISANGLRWKFVMSLNSFDQVNYLELIKKSLLKLQTYLFGILSLNMVQYWPLFCFWEASKWS